MTISPLKKPKLSVVMHHDLVNELDGSLSPMDGLVATDQVFLGLPRLHARSLFLPSVPSRLKLHHALLEWCGIGFSYVELGDALHVLELWPENDVKRRKKAKIVVTGDMFPDIVPQEADPAGDSDA
jgi:hypothetical protein